jgi:hypothetical protein
MTDLTRQELEEEEALNHSIDTMLYLLRTGTPGVVVSFNQSQNTVQVQPSLMGKQRNRDARPLPELLDVPVAFYGAGGYVVTHLPKKGDVCLLIASDRSLSRWKQAGGVIDPTERRRHNLTDSVAFFGLNHFADSYPDVKDGIDIRTRDGTTYINLLADQIKAEIPGATVTMTATTLDTVIGSAAWHMDGATQSLTLAGTPIYTATASGVAFSVPIIAPEATIAGVTQSTHKHTGVTPGVGTSGGPTN